MKQILILLFLITSISWSQVNMNIKMKDGTTQTFSIEEIRKLTFSGTVGIEDGRKFVNTINAFKLLQNYPNPFNPSTTIEYQIPEAGDVEVNIYNVSGQVVKTIESNFKTEGTHKVTWDSKNANGQNVASGIYIAQVKYQNALLVKKLMLIK